MEDLVINWLKDHYPILLVTVLVVLIVGTITWKISQAYNHWAKKIKDTEAQCARIDASIMPKFQEIETSLNSINRSMNALVAYLKGRDNSFDSGLFVSRSPIRLTDLGSKILDVIGGKAYIDKKKTLLIERMNEMGIDSAFDAQEKAPIVILERMEDDDDFKSIKDYMYLNPFYKETDLPDPVSLNTDTVSKIMGIYLRDVYLTTRPELKLD